MKCRIVQNCTTHPKNEWANAFFSLQICSMVKWLAALYTIVQFLSSVNHHVVLSLLASANDLLHCAHLCDFSPVWIIMWVLSLPAKTNDLLHSAHLCDFSTERVSLWAFRLPLSQIFSGIGHICKGFLHCCGSSLVLALSCEYRRLIGRPYIGTRSAGPNIVQIYRIHSASASDRVKVEAL